jgi:hypothetical protein
LPGRAVVDGNVRKVAAAAGVVIMTEHRIKLRRGWECQETGSPPSAARRLELPTRWTFEMPTRLTLTRRFGRPALDLDRQVLLLEMEQIAGTHSILLNAQPIALASATTSSHTIRLSDLAERNVLVLEIETPAPVVSAAGIVDDWGMISLIVRTIEPAHDSVASQIAPGVAGEIPLE